MLGPTALWRYLFFKGNPVSKTPNGIVSRTLGKQGRPGPSRGGEATGFPLVCCKRGFFRGLFAAGFGIRAESAGAAEAAGGATSAAARGGPCRRRDYSYMEGAGRTFSGH